MVSKRVRPCPREIRPRRCPAKPIESPTNPTTSLSETVSPTTVRTGSPVTFTYKETNTGSDALRRHRDGIELRAGHLRKQLRWRDDRIGRRGHLDVHVHRDSHQHDQQRSPSPTTPPPPARDTGDGNPAPTETASASVKVINPATSLSETASASSVPVGTPVTFTYKETTPDPRN